MKHVCPLLFNLSTDYTPTSNSKVRTRRTRKRSRKEYEKQSNRVWPSEEALQRMIHRIRFGLTNQELIDNLGPVYKEADRKASRGAAIASTSSQYHDRFLHFWRVMRKLNIGDDLTFGFPTDGAVLKVYIYYCSIIDKEDGGSKNKWITLRGKLRAIDSVATECGKEQSWSTNPIIAGPVAWVKKFNASDDSDTLPATKTRMLTVVRHTLKEKVRERIRTQRTSFWQKNDSKQDEWRLPNADATPGQRSWFLWTVSVITVWILGLRASECYRCTEEEYKGYGLQMRDLTFYKRHANKLTVMGRGDHTNLLHHVLIEIRFSKTEPPGKSVFLRLGRTREDIDPAQLLYATYRQQETGWNGKTRQRGGEDYVFETEEVELTKKEAVKRWAKMVAECIPIQPEQYRFHGIRKGFATQLQRVGTSESLIAFAGRWKLKSAIYLYIKHDQSDLLLLAKRMLYGREQNQEVLDWDRDDLNLCMQMAEGRVSGLMAASFQNSEGLYDGSVDTVPC